MFRPLALLAVLGAVAHADAEPRDPGVATYALVVGSNAGGPGQLDLRYAEDDARRIGALLAELGGYATDSIDVVVHPTPEILRQRLDRVSQRIAADAAAGRQARLFFYYSGHARSTAIDLGAQQLPLDELRQRLFGVPATLTVVVLDACQSGAFSRIKGATPVADFSFNSRQHLDAKGVAVLASSSGSELSQESELLQSSYFTHHLMVGLRGAGDTNHDGAVSVDEAYRYAYHQTLVATAATAVGGQHVSLEVDLKGHGEVPLSYPRPATSSIELPAAARGHALIVDRRARAVVAETQKAKGAPVRIAVAPGDYDVIVRDTDALLRCPVTAGPNGGTVQLDRCKREALATGTRKGGEVGLAFRGPVRLELGVWLGAERGDAYTETLRDFGYTEHDASSGIGLTALRQLEPRLWVGAAIARDASTVWRRPTEEESLEFEWSVTSILAVARGVQPLTPGRRLGVYAQLAAGVAIGRTRFDDQDGMTSRDTYVGPALTAGAGAYLGSPYGTGLSFVGGYQFGYARAIDNNKGETHGSGGHRLSLGVAWSF